MMLAALRSALLLFWSRDRKILLSFAAFYLAMFIACQVFQPGQVFRYFPPALPIMRLVPFFVPFSLLMFGAGHMTTLYLNRREGHFPRFFFALPLQAHEMVAPFIVYCVGMSAAFWLAGVLISDGRVLMLGAPGTPLQDETIAYWLPPLATSLLVWFQAIIWRPFGKGSLRVVALVAAILALVMVVFLRATGVLTQAEIIVGSLLQIPLAAFVGARGVARDRCGRAHDAVVVSGTGESSTGAEKAAQRRPLRVFTGPMDAQMWFERQLHRWNGLVVYAVPVLLLALFIFLDALGTATASPQAFRAFALIVLFALCWIMLAIGFALGLQSASFRSASQWQLKEALSMPPFFAALPMSTSDFVWVKLRVIATRMLWIAASAAVACIWVASRGGLIHLTGEPASALRHQYGDFTAGALLIAPVIAFVLLALAGAAEMMCLTLAGRAWNWLTVANCTRGVLYGLGGAATGIYSAAYRMWPPALPEILCALAAVKVATLAVLVWHVGTRRLLSWRRLSAILALWLATYGALLTTARSFLPDGLLSPVTLAALLVLVAPVQGTVAAPIALRLNRVR